MAEAFATSTPSATPSPSSAPPALTFDLSLYADTVDNAAANQAVCVIATSNGADVDLALKGSFMVWDHDHLAYWERGLNETLAGIQANPRVAVLARPKGASPLRFYGTASIVDDPRLREAMFQRVIPGEQARDPEKRGYAVLIYVDRIRQGPNTISR
jgi:hypothetical protein